MTVGKPLRPDHPELTVRSRAAWRRWLQKHHSSSRGVWFVHFRKERGEKSVAYDDLVEKTLSQAGDEVTGQTTSLACAIAHVGDFDRRPQVRRAPFRIVAV